MKSMPIPAFDVARQRHIAEILSAVDEAIGQTEALIAKTQQVKAGLMHDLLTRGVTASGQLRPLRREAPELYKQSPLGWVPKDWEIVRIESLCSQIVDCPHSTPVYVPSGVPCIRTADLTPGKLLIDQALTVKEEAYRIRVARLTPKQGDIIYSREGERLGIAAPVGEERLCLGQRVMLLRANPQTDAGFLLWAMNTTVFLKGVASGLGATTSPHVNVTDICTQLIVKPNHSEQEKIGIHMTACEAEISAEKARQNKLRSLKSALMHDLLTGRVRVPVSKDAP